MSSRIARPAFSARLTLLAAALTFACGSAHAAFGLTSSTDFYTVDTGAGLVFKVRRTDNGSSTQSAGDIASLVYNGVEYQDQSRGSQITAGFDYLYNGVTAVTVSAATVGTDYVKITVQAGNLTHYYMAKNGANNIYMGTYFTTEPDIHNLVRYIVRVPNAVLPNGPTPSNILNNTGAIESSDIFGLSNGETRSKHYSNARLRDWTYFGATGSNVGMWFVRDNNEGGSGGPFYRSLRNQGSTDQELTYIVNYGEAQTETTYRTGILNAYTLVFNSGAAPTTPDTSWFSQMGLLGYVAPSGRGGVAGVGINGRASGVTYTVGFSNPTAQYYTTADATDGHFMLTGMRPGTYTMTTYKNELAVDSRNVTVTAGQTLALNSFTITQGLQVVDPNKPTFTGDPGADSAVWRIGTWDGSPQEFLNGDKVTTMHPSDVRMSSWVTPTFTVGSSSAATGWPAYQWKNVNGTLTIKFNLTSAQVTAHTIRIGITTAYSSARPQITVNPGTAISWTSAVPSATDQPSTRSLTIGSYRGNNFPFTYSVDASHFVAGWNTLTITPASGTTGTGYLSPGYSFDAIDML